MKFKVDENLPLELAGLLINAGYDAKTVNNQGLQGESDSVISEVCAKESRILVTLDLDFADIRTYPPLKFPGFIVMRLGYQDKKYIIKAFKKVIPLLRQEILKHHLWIVEEERIRIHGDS